MKNSFESFRSSSLDAQQLKSLKGGVRCECTYHVKGGAPIKEEGQCGWDDAIDCKVIGEDKYEWADSSSCSCK